MNAICASNQVHFQMQKFASANLGKTGCDLFAREILNTSKSSKTFKHLFSKCWNHSFSKLKNILPVHLIAIANRFDLISDFCKKYKENKSQQPQINDALRNSPLHFRALSMNLGQSLKDDPFYKAYKKCRVLFNKAQQKNLQHHLSPQQLLNFAQSQHFAEKKLEQETFKALIKPKPTQKISKNLFVDQACMGNFYWTQQSVASPIHLLREWFYFGAPDKKVSASTKKSLDKFSFLIKPSLNKGCGVFSLQDIPEKTNFGFYTGQRVVKRVSSKKSYEYEFVLESTLDGKRDLGIDAKKFRSVVSMINDGLPNALVKQEKPKTSFQGQLPGYSIETIKDGHEILVDYGNVYYQKLTWPVSKVDLDKAIELCQDKKSFFDKIFNPKFAEKLNMHNSLYVKYVAILNTPKLLFKLASDLKNPKMFYQMRKDFKNLPLSAQQVDPAPLLSLKAAELLAQISKKLTSRPNEMNQLMMALDEEINKLPPIKSFAKSWDYKLHYFSQISKGLKIGLLDLEAGKALSLEKFHQSFGSKMSLEETLLFFEN